MLTDTAASPSSPPTVLRYAAFGTSPGGGNPAGVVLDADGLDDDAMLRIAREVGASETAFVVAAASAGEGDRLDVRYFSPGAEVPFCGHATVATAVAWAEEHGPGRLTVTTRAGVVEVETQTRDEGVVARFTSPEPWVSELAPPVLDRLLAVLRLERAHLDRKLPPLEVWAGNPHPVLVLADEDAFDALDYDASALRVLMDEQGWTGTVTVLFARGGSTWEARNPFPVGDIREDPATGSAAASTGAYLRHVGAVSPPTDLTILQGRHVGRPSRLEVTVPVRGGITVTGGAVRIDGPR